MFHKFLIRDDDHFVLSTFPQLEISLQKIKEQLENYPLTPKTEMILSFVKHHSISSQLVKDYPELATLISSKSQASEMLRSGIDWKNTSGIPY